MSEWQSIETAVDTDSEVLLYFPWNKPRPQEIIIGSIKCWRDMATHWQPLPKPPKE